MRPRTRVLIVDDHEAVLGVLMAGAGFLLKNASHEELLRGIRAVAAGDSLLDPAVTHAVTDRLVQLATEGEHPLLMAQGDTNREIAERLVISETTARNHVRHILDELGVRRRGEAAVLAAQIGLGAPHE